MNAAAQLQMFEPQSGKLAELVAVHTRNGEFETRRAANLATAGYMSAAAMSTVAASECFEQAAICETALQFEQLAGLS